MHADTPSTIVSAAGNARPSTVIRKLPRTRAVLGSSASTNDGNPIASDENSVSCIGWNGYPCINTSISIASSDENIVLVKNSEAERDMLFITRRPSATTAGIEAKFESNSTMFAT